MSVELREPETKTPPSGAARVAQQFAFAMELPFLLAGALFIGAGLGYLLDKWLHTGPVFLLIFGAAGFAGGLREMLRRMKAMDRKTKRGGAAGPEDKGDGPHNDAESGH